MNLMKRNNPPPPLIYIRGLKSEDLVAMVDFLYCGEANVYQENVDSFLALANEFKIKGLMGPVDKSEPDEAIANNGLPKIKTPKPLQASNDLFEEIKTPELSGALTNDEAGPLLGGTITVPEHSPTPDLQDLAQNIKSMITSVKLASELGEITFSSGKQKLTPGEVPAFQGF